MAGYDPAMPSPAGEPAPGRHVLVVADGDVPSRAALDAAWPGWDEAIVGVIAADGGLARVRAIGMEPTLLVGDLDSLDPTLIAAAEASSLPIRRSAAAKDESDAELAMLAAVSEGATRVTVLGAFGGSRLDHALANVWLLAHPALHGIEVALLDARTRASLLSAPGPGGAPVRRSLPGRPGAIVTLLPFGGDVSGVTTEDLRYPLRDEPLLAGPARGLSNVREGTDAAVTVRRGRLLVIEIAP